MPDEEVKFELTFVVMNSQANSLSLLSVNVLAFVVTISRIVPN